MFLSLVVTSFLGLKTMVASIGPFFLLLGVLVFIHERVIF